MNFFTVLQAILQEGRTSWAASLPLSRQEHLRGIVLLMVEAFMRLQRTALLGLLGWAEATKQLQDLVVDPSVAPTSSRKHDRVVRVAHPIYRLL